VATSAYTLPVVNNSTGRTTPTHHTATSVLFAVPIFTPTHRSARPLPPSSSLFLLLPIFTPTHHSAQPRTHAASFSNSRLSYVLPFWRPYYTKFSDGRYLRPLRCFSCYPSSLQRIAPHGHARMQHPSQILVYLMFSPFGDLTILSSRTATFRCTGFRHVYKVTLDLEIRFPFASHSKCYVISGLLPPSAFNADSMAVAVALRPTHV